MENLPEVQQRVDTKIIDGTLTPCSFEGLYRMAKIMAASGMMPKGVQTVEAVFTAVQMGMEVGLSPMQAVQSIAVIGGRPSIWGDTVLALVRRSGLLEDFNETITGAGEAMKATCTAKRRGETSPVVREFTVADARQANLWGKDGPWKQYPKRMLQMRARSWTLRDGFSDVLKGLRVAEEVMDYDLDMKVTASGAYVPNIDDVLSPPENPEEMFEKLAADIAGPDLDAFVDHAAKFNEQTTEQIKAQAVENWDRFSKGFKKFLGKRAKVKAAEEVAPGSQPEPDRDHELPISATPEYKRLMALKDEFREFYLSAKADTGKNPDTVENCSALIDEIDRMIALDNDR